MIPVSKLSLVWKKPNRHIVTDKKINPVESCNAHGHSMSSSAEPSYGINRQASNMLERFYAAVMSYSICQCAGSFSIKVAKGLGLDL